jgi:hypothetical protein
MDSHLAQEWALTTKTLQGDRSDETFFGSAPTSGAGGRMRLMVVVTAAASSLGWTTLPAQAQTDSHFVEIGGFAGLNARLPSLAGDINDALRSTGIAGGRAQTSERVKWAGGGGIAAQVSQSFWVVGDYAYNRLAKTEVTLPTGGGQRGFSMTAKLHEFTAGLQGRIPAGRSAAVPYFSAGGGAARSAVTTNVPNLVSATFSETDPTVYFAIGVRLPAASRLIVRPEFRVVRVPGQTYFRAAAGVFFRLGD